jgi:hypothetical protein
MAALAWSLATAARADEPATYGGALTPDETQFVASIQSDLGRRFPRASDAEKSGYTRYTEEDDSGAISYANRQWVSDPRHPSQLWYDKLGDLLGADFSVPRPHGEPRPALWGINPGRWVEFDGHVHWVDRDTATGALKFDALWNKNWVAAGGSLTDPSPDTIVKLGEAKTAADVVTVFEFPTIWDLIVWVKPNPNGAFAEMNPTVDR